MTENTEKLLDDVGWQLLYLLQENARLSFKELGQRVGLAPSSVAERIHRMEEAEILLGYHAQINLEKVGLPILVSVPPHIHLVPGEHVSLFIEYSSRK